MQRRQKFQRIQVLRFFAAATVVVYHAQITVLSYLGGTPPFSLIKYGQYGVDLFFVISGFIIVYIGSTLENAPILFAWRRFARVVPMYWIVTLALFALSYLPGIARAGPPDVDLLLRSMFFLSWTKGNEVYPILNVGWSLEYEVLFYIIATAGMALAKRPWGITAFIMLALVTSGRGTSFFLQNPIIVEFVLGMTIATALIDRPSFLPMLAGTALVIATLALAPTVQVWRLLMFGLPSAVVVAGAVMLDNRRSYAGRILPELGNASYSIYLTHVVVISLACKLMVKLAPATPLPVAIAAISILSVAAGYVVYRVLELRLTSLISRRPLREASPVHPMPGSNT